MHDVAPRVFPVSTAGLRSGTSIEHGIGMLPGVFPVSTAGLRSGQAVANGTALYVWCLPGLHGRAP